MRSVGAAAGSAIIGLIVFCLFILNLFGGIVSGIWLAILGEWGFVLGGIAATFVMPWVYSIAALPALGIGALVLACGNPPNRVAVGILGLVASIWASSLIGLWTFLVFFSFMRHSNEVASLPLLLWGYSITMAPLAYMAKSEGPDSTGTSLGLMLAMIAYVVLATLYFLGSPIGTMLIAVGVAVVAESILATVLGVALTPSKKQYNDEADLDDENPPVLRDLQRQHARAQRDLELLEDPETIFAFGQMTYEGDGVPQNYAEAASWFRIAAEKGHVKAAHNLALMCEEGKGVREDFTEAAKWYQCAATAGNAASQNNLGVFFEKGQGVGHDVVMAATLYRQAALNGDANALPNLKRLTEALKQAALNGSATALEDFQRLTTTADAGTQVTSQ